MGENLIFAGLFSYQFSFFSLFHVFPLVMKTMTENNRHLVIGNREEILKIRVVLLLRKGRDG